MITCLVPAQVEKAGAASGGRASGIVSPTNQTSVLELVADLGAESYERRERATRLLVDRGQEAFEDLRSAAESDDREVARRASRVLRAGFLKGRFAQPSANQASWRRLTELLEDNLRTRRLFVEMQSAAPELLTLAETDPERCPAFVAEYLRQDPRTRPTTSLFAKGAVTAAIFALNCETGEPDPKTSAVIAGYLVSKAQTLFARTDPNVRPLLQRWILRAGEKADAGQQYALFRLVTYFELGKCKDLARRIAVNRRGGGRSYQAQAMLFLAKFGGIEDVDLLEKNFGDKGYVGQTRTPNGSVRLCQLGDVALAACVLLTEQELTEYGFEGLGDSDLGRNDYRQYGQFGFRTDETRQQARQRWMQYRGRAE